MIILLLKKFRDLLVEFHDFSTTTVIFHDFPRLKNSILKFHNFAGNLDDNWWVQETAEKSSVCWWLWHTSNFSFYCAMYKCSDTTHIYSPVLNLHCTCLFL